MKLLPNHPEFPEGILHQFWCFDQKLPNKLEKQLEGGDLDYIPLTKNCNFHSIWTGEEKSKMIGQKWQAVVVHKLY